MRLFRDLFNRFFSLFTGRPSDGDKLPLKVRSVGGNFATYQGRGSGAFKKNQRVELKKRSIRKAKRMGKA